MFVFLLLMLLLLYLIYLKRIDQSLQNHTTRIYIYVVTNGSLYCHFIPMRIIVHPPLSSYITPFAALFHLWHVQYSH